jgi:hypothetical protein
MTRYPTDGHRISFAWSESPSGVEDLVGVEGCFDVVHEVAFGGADHLREEPLFEASNPVFAGDRAAEAQGGLHDVVEGRQRGLFGWLVVQREDDRRVQIAVAGLAECSDRDVAAGRRMTEPSAPRVTTGVLVAEAMRSVAETSSIVMARTTTAGVPESMSAVRSCR